MDGITAAALRLDTFLDQGGEADVYRVIDHPELLIKVFRAEPAAEDHRRIDRIIAKRTSVLEAVVAWPQRWVRMGGQDALVLPFVRGAEPIHMLFDRVTWASAFPDATWAFMVKVARNAAAAVAAIHAAGLAVVDISEKNMLVGRDGKVTVIDCDSFVFLGEGSGSISSCYSAGWPPPELMPRLAHEPRTANHDNFSLARLIFKLLFAGRAPLEPVPGSSPDDKRRVFGYSEIHRVRPPSPGDVALSDLPARMARYFERAFADPGSGSVLRPTAQDWADALMEMQTALQPCGRSPQHRYAAGGGRTCPWCRIAAAPQGSDPFRSVNRPAAAAAAGAPQSNPTLDWWWALLGLLVKKLSVASTSAWRLWAGTSFTWLWTWVSLFIGLGRFIFGWALVIGIGWFFIQHSSGLLNFADQLKRSVVAGLQHHPPARQSSAVAQRAADYAVSLSADFSKANASQILDKAYAASVTYYGNTTSHASVMHEKNGLITKWTRRNYVPRADSVAATCNQGGTYCSVTLVTDFQVSNDRESKPLRAWWSTIGLDMTRNPPLVVLEDGGSGGWR